MGTAKERYREIAEIGSWGNWPNSSGRLPLKASRLERLRDWLRYVWYLWIVYVWGVWGCIPVLLRGRVRADGCAQAVLQQALRHLRGCWALIFWSAVVLL